MIFFIRNAKIIFIIELKKYVVSIYILDIIINKLYHKKKLYLIILFKVIKDLKTNFYYIILFFNLAIYLKIKDS